MSSGPGLPWRRTLWRIASGLLLGAAAAVLVVWLGLRASLPPRSGHRVASGLERPVEIRFDARARPYVRAETLGDALLAEGFLHARERLWQMELLRRAGRGRLAEALGPGLLDADRALWRAGVPQLAATLEANAGGDTRARVARYVSGVNAGLASLRTRPPELWLARIHPEPWTPRDVFALGALMAFQSARNQENELLRLALRGVLDDAELAAFVPEPSAYPGFRDVLAREPASWRDPDAARPGPLEALDAAARPLLPSLSLGSNGWVVAPSRTRGGRVLFAFDSHDALALPDLFYEVHLFFGDGRCIRGWSVAGLPGVINGANERVAWGLTNTGDSQDLFLETRDPDDPRRFLGPSGWYVAQVEAVAIPVRGRAEPERLEIVHTRNGPLVSDEPPLSLAWTAHHLDGLGLDALFDMNLATDWEGFRAALDRFAAPPTNVTYGDVDGHVAFRTAGLLPRRGRGTGLWPQRGDAADAGWQGMVPASELPELVDPPRGFVAAANARVNPPGTGPLVSADDTPGYRIQRITRVLGDGNDHDPDSMRALQMDWHHTQAERLLPVLRAALDGVTLDPAERRAREILLRWEHDPVAAPDAAGPLIFETWYVALARALFVERLGPVLWSRLARRNYVLNHAVDGLVLGDGGSPWWRGDREARLREAFRAAVSALAAEYGAEPTRWRWDARNAVHLEHELAAAVPLLGGLLSRGPFPWGGSHATVGRAGSRYDRPGFVNHAATVRVVAEMTEPMRMWAVIPGGQSGHPLDPHYDDQVASWLEGRLDPLADSFEAVTGPGLVLEPREPVAGSRRTGQGPPGRPSDATPPARPGARRASRP